jgi:hypothetical protein
MLVGSGNLLDLDEVSVARAASSWQAPPRKVAAEPIDQARYSRSV